jgi:hypothetical protein
LTIIFVKDDVRPLSTSILSMARAITACHPVPFIRYEGW